MIHHKNRGGFTLIELLVVIGVIALLMALLFPAFQMVRQRAQAAECLLNQRQIGQAILVYVSDHQGAFPPRYVWGPHWGDYIEQWEYLPATARTKLNCPVRRESATSYVNSYGFSDWLDWNGNGCCPVYITGMRNWGGPNRDPNRPDAPLAQVPILAESNHYRINFQDQPSFVIVERHMGKANVFWADGHSSARTLEEMLAEPQRNYWGQYFTYGCGSPDTCGPTDLP